LFDDIVMVDWSSNTAPKTGPDSIWSSHKATGRPTQSSPTNHPTRRDAEEYLFGLVDELVVRPRERGASPSRMLVGLDFPFGFPEGVLAAVGPLLRTPLATYRDLWRWFHAERFDQQRGSGHTALYGNDLHVAARFNDLLYRARSSAVPASWDPDQDGRFFVLGGGDRPAQLQRRGISLPTLAGTKLFGAGKSRGTVRRTDTAASGTAQAASLWQLDGPGAVGRQMVSGLPTLHRLLLFCSANAVSVEVWPLDNGFTPPVPTADIVVVEIFPSLFKAQYLGEHHPQDADQVHTYAETVAAADQAGTLGSWFTPSGAATPHGYEREEAWMFGLR